MKTLYLDIFSGISGDMFLGALIDLGVNAQKLERELGKLSLQGYHLHVSRRQSSGIDGVKFDVHLGGHEIAGRKGKSKLDPSHRHGRPTNDHQHGDEANGGSHARDFREIRRLIQSSKLSNWVKQRSVAVFERIAVAEGKIHGVEPEHVHFHEVGAVDSIVDVVGACIALEMLGKPRVISSAVVEGTGWIDCEHGRFPVPAPATLAILGARGIGVTQCEEPHELVTPTGAALVAEFAETFGRMAGISAEKIGFGLGTRENRTRPNVLRVVLGDAAKENSKRAANDWETDAVAVLETNLDDINPEILGAFVEKTLAEGALDVFHTPIQMKKNRPGVLLTVLCAELEADRFCEMILRETTAFGVRRSTAQRRKLRREFKQVRTRFGEVTVKLGKLNGEVVQAAPEFESCRKAGERAKAPLKAVYEAAISGAGRMPRKAQRKASLPRRRGGAEKSSGK